jgi:hypothetical protein
MSAFNDQEIDSLADHIERSVGGPVTVSHGSYDLGGGRTLGMCRATQRPLTGLSAACTFGLFREEWGDRDFPGRVELLIVSAAGDTEYERVLATVAREVVAQHALPTPGRVYADAVRAADVTLASRMPDALILNPFLWDPPDFAPFESTSGRVWFCEVVPIFAAEREFIATSGFDNFEAILREDGTRFWDRTRACHVY